MSGDLVRICRCTSLLFTPEGSLWANACLADGGDFGFRQIIPLELPTLDCGTPDNGISAEIYEILQ
jgi:hypothetical protein